MKTEKISNYQKLCGEWAEKFLLMDKEELMKRLPELKREKDYMTIWHFGVKFGVSEKDGSIICMSEEREPEVTEMLNIYTLLGYVKSDAFFMNKWVPFADLRGARPFGPAYKIGVTDVFAATFSDHEEELREVLGDSCSEEDIMKLLWSEVDRINSDAPAYRMIKKVIHRKTDFVHNTSSKLIRFAEENKREE